MDNKDIDETNKDRSTDNVGGSDLTNDGKRMGGAGRGRREIGAVAGEASIRGEDTSSKHAAWNRGFDMEEQHASNNEGTESKEKQPVKTYSSSANYELAHAGLKLGDDELKDFDEVSEDSSPGAARSPTAIPDILAQMTHAQNRHAPSVTKSKMESVSLDDQTAAQVSVSPANEAQSLGKVKSETLVDITQKSSPNSDADELLEARNEDVSQNSSLRNADVPVSTIPSTLRENVANSSQPLLMPTGAPEINARQQDYDNSARAGSPTPGSQPAAQVPVSPANEAQSLWKVESETLVDVTQPQQSCPNSDPDELLEARNEDVSQNSSLHNADVPVSTNSPALGENVANSFQPLLMPTGAPEIIARQQDYDNSARAGSPTSGSQPRAEDHSTANEPRGPTAPGDGRASNQAAQVPVSPANEAQSLGKVKSETLVDVMQPQQSCPNSDADGLLEARNEDASQNFSLHNADVPVSTNPSTLGENVANSSQPLLMLTGAPEINTRQQDYDNSARPGSPTSGSQPVPVSTNPSTRGENVANSSQPFLMLTGAPEINTRQQDYDNSARAGSPTSGSQPDPLGDIYAHFNNRLMRTTILPRRDYLYRDYLQSPEQHLTPAFANDWMAMYGRAFNDDPNA